MDELRQTEPATATLDRHSDEELRVLIGAAQQLLADRENARKRDAAAQIRRIAQESGLAVTVSRRARKRRRPANAK